MPTALTQPKKPAPEKKKSMLPLLLPGKLGPNTRKPPSSLEGLLKRHQLWNASMGRFKEALAPYVGGQVRWKLRSWGGEATTGSGFDTPSGEQPLKLGRAAVGRVRMIARSLGPSADLSTVMNAGHPVVVCLALFPQGDDDRFVRTDDQRALTPNVMGPVVVEGTIWGVTKGPHLWLHNCREILP